MKKAIFFDRDGIVNYRPVGDYIKSADEFRFIPDFIEFFKYIKNKDYLAIVITNQQGVGKKVMTEADLINIHNKMQEDLKNITEFQFDDIYYCTNLATEFSCRRKPNPGMLLEAIEKWNINRSLSWMIGDSLSDVIAGRNAEVNTIYIGKSNKNAFINADKEFISLNDAKTFFENFVF